MAKLRPVKCLYCSESLDRNTEEFVTVGKRYAHALCQKKVDESKSQDEKDKEALIQYIGKLYGTCGALHHKQIKDLHSQGYSYSSMLKTLIYFYEVRKNTTERSKGIGIIPFVYKDAYDYYYKLHMIATSAEKVKQSELSFNTRVVKIKPPQVKKKKGKVFDFDALEEGIKHEQ